MALTKQTRLNGRVIERRMSEAPKGVELEINGKLGKSEQNENAEKDAWIFGPDQDFSTFYKAARRFNSSA